MASIIRGGCLLPKSARKKEFVTFDSDNIQLFFFFLFSFTMAIIGFENVTREPEGKNEMKKKAEKRCIGLTESNSQKGRPFKQQQQHTATDSANFILVDTQVGSLVGFRLISPWRDGRNKRQLSSSSCSPSAGRVGEEIIIIRSTPTTTAGGADHCTALCCCCCCCCSYISALNLLTAS